MRTAPVSENDPKARSLASRIGGGVGFVDSAREENKAHAAVGIYLEPGGDAHSAYTLLIFARRCEDPAGCPYGYPGATRAESFADGGMVGAENAWDASGGHVHGGAPPQL